MCPDANTLAGLWSSEVLGCTLCITLDIAHQQEDAKTDLRKPWFWKAKYFLHVVTMVTSSRLLS